MLFLKMNDGLVALLSIFFILLTIGFGFLIYYLYKKEKRRFNDEVSNYIEGIETKNEISSSVNSFINKSLGAEFSLMLIDIDKYSDIVENIGEEESKHFIKTIAEKLLKIVPSKIRIGRVGDDQFLLFAYSDITRNDVIRLAKNIVETLNKPYTVYDDTVLSVSASIGICYFPAHGRNYNELFKSLEIALYMCKRNGGNQYRIYNKSSKNEESNTDYYLQIKNGIKNKEFDLYFQPIIDESDNIYAIEGLLRWNHPELGLLSPYKFINYMEQTGDINWVGLWGLERLIKEYVEIRKRFDIDFLVTLNLSPKQLTNRELPNEFLKIVKKYRVKPANIVLEIEEFEIYDRYEQIQENLQKFKEIGFVLAIDGFGLDYKSLKKLEKTPIKIVKLDKDSLSDEGDELKLRFIEMLVEFSNANDRTLICEGVEDENYLNRAKNIGIKIFQGYHFSKPISSTDLEKYIKDKIYK